MPDPVRFGLVGPAYTSQALPADAQECINFYVEQDESGAGNAPLVLYPTPGTRAFVDLNPSPEVSVGLQNARVSLSAAQLNGAAMTGTPVPLIAAPGAGLLIVPLFITTQYTFVSVAYSGAAGLDPIIGLGSTLVEVQDSFVVEPNFQQLAQVFNATQCTLCLGTANNLAPSLLVNQPLSWADNGGADGSGNGTILVHIQYYVLNVATGEIVNGSPTRVFGSKSDFTAAQLKAANITPLQLVATPGANKMIVPLSAVVWHKFHSAGFNLSGIPNAGYGTLTADIAAANIFRNFDSNSFNLGADSMEQQGANFVNRATMATSKIVNQPLSWINTIDISAATGDTTASVYVQYLIVDLIAGTLAEGSGDLRNERTGIPAAQIKNASVSAVEVAPAPSGVGPTEQYLNVPWYGICQTNFVTTAYTVGNGGVPSPRVNPGPATPVFITALLNFSNAGWGDSSTEMRLVTQAFYEPPNSSPGSQVAPATVINQPLSWGNFGDITASTADGTCILNLPYVAIDTATGSVLISE